jgi:hypothetical protein
MAKSRFIKFSAGELSLEEFNGKLTHAEEVVVRQKSADVIYWSTKKIASDAMFKDSHYPSDRRHPFPEFPYF